jgi:WD40 repeat protein
MLFLSIFQVLWTLIRASWADRAHLVLENRALRQQLAVLVRASPRPRLRCRDRLFWVVLSRIWSGWKSALALVQPATVIRWHRQGFKLYWRWKSRGSPGRPTIPRALIALIARMSRDNPTWGAPRIQSELALLGHSLAESTVAKYMTRPQQPRSQSWLAAHRQSERNEMLARLLLVLTELARRAELAFGGIRRDQTEDGAMNFAGMSITIAFLYCLASSGEEKVSGAGPPKEKTRTGVDLYGDALPVGALTRLGTVRLRHPGHITALAVSADGKMAASSGYSRFFAMEDLTCAPRHCSSILLWDLASGREILRFSGHAAPPQTLAFSPDGKLLASAATDGTGADNTVRLWELRTGRQIRSFAVKHGYVPICFSPDSSKLAWSDGEKNLRVWDVLAGKEVLVEACPGAARFLAFSRDGKALGVLEADRLRLWEIPSGRVSKVVNFNFPPSESPLWFLFLPKQNEVLLQLGGKAISRWSLDEQRETKRYPGVLSGSALDGSVVGIRNDRELYAWDVTHDRNVASLRVGGPWLANIWLRLYPGGVVFPEDKQMVVATWNKIQQLKLGGGNDPHASRGHSKEVVCLGFSWDKKSLIAVGGTTIRFWNLRTAKELCRLEAHDGPILSACLAPNGEILATGAITDSGYEVKVWDLRKRMVKFRLQGSYVFSNRLTISPDSKRICFRVDTGGDKGLDMRMSCYELAEGAKPTRFSSEALWTSSQVAFGFLSGGTTLGRLDDKEGLSFAILDAK